jgi:mannose/cellobiose epimerase-like protein (N-acyl-D-glucosamine 2-epimerase family)
LHARSHKAESDRACRVLRFGFAARLAPELRYSRILTGDKAVLDIADATLDYLDEAAASVHGGYLDAVPPPGATRRPNPLMHLFEALIALYDATGRARYL